MPGHVTLCSRRRRRMEETNCLENFAYSLLKLPVFVGHDCKECSTVWLKGKKAFWSVITWCNDFRSHKVLGSRRVHFFILFLSSSFFRFSYFFALFSIYNTISMVRSLHAFPLQSRGSLFAWNTLQSLFKSPTGFSVLTELSFPLINDNRQTRQ